MMTSGWKETSCQRSNMGRAAMDFDMDPTEFFIWEEFIDPGIANV